MTYDKKAQEFEDFVTVQLYKIGLSVNAFISQKYQYEIGEGLGGIEIKNDATMHKTGNLYIETHERRDVNSHFVESGILRKDNTWLWCIGDETTLYLIGKQQLQRIHKYYPDGNEKITMVRRQTDTSLGFTLSREWVEENIALVVIHCENKVDNDKQQEAESPVEVYPQYWDAGRFCWHTGVQH